MKKFVPQSQDEWVNLFLLLIFIAPFIFVTRALLNAEADAEARFAPKKKD